MDDGDFGGRFGGGGVERVRDAAARPALLLLLLVVGHFVCMKMRTEESGD